MAESIHGPADQAAEISRLRRRVAELERTAGDSWIGSDEALGRIATGVAHELNNLLTPIVGFTELALEDLDPTARASQRLVEVLHAAARARESVAQILRLGREQAGERALVRVSAFSSDVLRMFRASLPCTIRIEEQHTASDDRVLADESQLGRALVDLFENAASRLRTRGGVLRLATSTPDDAAGSTVTDRCVELVVSDTERRGARLTIRRPKRDARIDAIAGVRAVVTAHGGTIRTHSETARGTSVHLRLPSAFAGAR